MASHAPPLDVRSSGSISIDYVSGMGGLVKGALVEVFGPPSIGKTSMSFYMMAEALRSDPERYVGFIALEGLFDPDWAEALTGMDASKVLLVEPVGASATSEALYQMVKSGHFSTIVLDSVGAIMDDSEQDKGSVKVGGSARVVGNIVRRIVTVAWQTECTVILINQVRSAMDSRNPYALTTPGGWNLKHGVQLKLELKPVFLEKEERAPYLTKDENEKDSRTIGRRVAVIARKNKGGSFEGRTAQFDFWFDPPAGTPLGLDKERELVDLAFRLNLIARAGSYYRHDLFGQLQGKTSVIDYFRQNPKAIEKLREEIFTEKVSMNGSKDN